ncbi:restriction endonuclease subunit S, partial [Staphylococcus condimenti]
LIMSFKLTLGKLAIVKKPIYEYMYYYLTSINIKTFGAQAVKGITLNNDSINSITVKLPIIDEQIKISKFLTDFENLTEKQSIKVKLLKNYKNGLLRKMFV